MDKPIVKLSGVTKSFGGVKILDGIDLSLKAGGFYSIIGKSGCGKSTLLRCLNGLEILDQGRIEINGIILENNSNKDLESKYHEVRSQVGMVFQSFQLFPHYTLLDNVKQPQIIVKKISEEEALENANALLAKVGLSDHASKYPYQLSGGQQQRGSIARALALKPKVMLYDEPTSALDPQLIDEVHQVMRDLDNEKMTQIVVTHEMSFARDIADTVIFIDHGKIVEMGEPTEMFSSPTNELTRQFLRKYL
jgi:polar amino acid transport system ATP-binding protein